MMYQFKVNTRSMITESVDFDKNMMDIVKI